MMACDPYKRFVQAYFPNASIVAEYLRIPTDLIAHSGGM